MGGLHPVLEYYYEVNNIPKPGERSNVNLNDLKYLEARIKYEQALLYKDKGDIKTRGFGLNTYNDRVLSDKKNKPPRCYEDVEDGSSGNRKLCVECSYCAFKVDCWQDVNNGSGLRKFIYSSGPRWLTVVKKEPNVMEDLA